jgi:hypothetical protein
MNFLHEFNQPNCGLHTCTKCSTTPINEHYREELNEDYLTQSFPTLITPQNALQSIKFALEDVMESMNCTQTAHVHDDGSITVVDGPNVRGALYHLFNSIKNTLTKAGINLWEYSDALFLENANIDPDSISFEDFLDRFLESNKPDEE